MPRIGRVSAFPAAADMGGHTPVPVEDLDRGCAEPDLDLPAGKRVRDAVEAAVDLDVVVDVDPRLAPLGVLVAIGRERPECRDGPDPRTGCGGCPRSSGTAVR